MSDDRTIPAAGREWAPPIRDFDRVLIPFGVIVLGGAVFPAIKMRAELAWLHPDLLYQASMVFILVGAVSRLFLMRGVAARLAFVPWLILLVAWMVVSQAWTTAPQRSVAVLAALTTSTAFGLYLTMIGWRHEMLRLLAYGILAVAAGSLILETVTDYRTGLPGLFSNRNLLSRFAGFGIILSIFLLIYRDLPQRQSLKLTQTFVWSLTLASCSYIMMSRFAFTSQLALAAAGAATIWVFALRADWRLGVLGALIAASLAAAVFWSAEEISRATGNIESFNNRLYHWGQLISQELVSPWTGAGLGGFWDRDTGPFHQVALLGPLQHGHNGFIDVWLDLGLVGVALLAVNLIAIGLACLRYLFGGWSPHGSLASAVLVYLIFNNLTESALLPTSSANTLMWAVFVALTLSLTPRDRATSPSLS